MINVSITDLTTLVAFWLVFTRWVAILFQLPVFDTNTIPSVVKILTSLLIAYTFFPYSKNVVIQEVQFAGADSFWLLTISHTVVGLIIGYLAKSIMNLFTASGSIMTQQVGFNSISYFDPSQAQRTGPFENIIRWTILIMIITSGALIPMLKGGLGSFESINFMSYAKFSHAPEFYFRFFKEVFGSAIMLATPLLFMNFLLNLVMGIIARTIPQMNVLMVSFAVNIGLGLLVFFAISEEYFSVAFDMYVRKLGEWFQFIT